jgi:hypothetical protein
MGKGDLILDLWELWIAVVVGGGGYWKIVRLGYVDVGWFEIYGGLNYACNVVDVEVEVEVEDELTR